MRYSFIREHGRLSPFASFPIKIFQRPPTILIFARTPQWTGLYIFNCIAGYHLQLGRYVLQI
jgi:hypothetical protein